jgi:hypothetical protein
MRYVDELKRHGTVLDHVGCAAEIVRLYEENVRLTATQPQPCSPSEDGVCEALECCKQLREQNTMLDAEAAKDEALLRQALEALERGETALRFAAIAALRERLKA